MHNTTTTKDIEQLDYSTESAQILIREFVNLLHEVSSNYERAFLELETLHKRELAELNEMLAYYQNTSSAPGVIFNTKKHLRKWSRAAIISFIYFVFRVGKKCVIMLGVTEKVKKTQAYESFRQRYKDMGI